MSRFFISYRHVSPDQELGHALSVFLGARGQTVFLDTKISVGARWVDEIENEIRNADFFVVLLSEHSVRSDMVRQEVALAHRLASEGKLCIFPVRVAYTADLPYDLASYLNPLQNSLWKAGEPFERICQEIETARMWRTGQPLQAKVEAAAVPFDAHELDRLSDELAAYVGPMARVLVRRAVRGAQNWKQLYDLLGEEVPAGAERQRFLAKRRLG